MARTAVAATLLGGLLAACTPTPTASAHTTPEAMRPSASTLIRANTPPMPTPQPTPTPLPRLAIPPGTLRCHTAQLEVALVGGAAAAGTVLEDFEMRNRSGTGCWVYGYVGFQVLDSTGRPLRQTVSRATDLFFGRSTPPTAIFLPSGTAGLGLNQGLGHAFFNVATDDVLCTSDYYDNITRLEIWPPDEFTALIIPAGNPAGVHFVTCGSMTINPLQVQQGPSYSS